MNPIGLIITVVVILVISAVVTAITQFMNKVNDANAVNRKALPARPRAAKADNAAAPPAKAGEVDMDRFLAEIDRLRRKNNVPAAEPARPTPPVVQPVKQQDRPRPRVVAEVAEPHRGGQTAFPSAPAFPAAPTSPSAPTSVPGVTRLADLPVATIITPTSGTGAQHATRVTSPMRRASATPKTDFGKAFAGLLSTGKGAALAVVLQEVMGPPKSKRKG